MTKRRLSFFLSLAFLLGACAAPREAPPEKLQLEPVSFDALPAWRADKIGDALPALLRSCRKEPRATAAFYGRVGATREAWRDACAALARVSGENDETIRATVESVFRPYKVRNRSSGLFTGYYEAVLRGSDTRAGVFQTPLWARPSDLITADLGAFRESLSGQKITGKIAGQKFVPYDTREEVAQGSLQGRAEPLLWTDDPIGAFFLEIQGSGRIEKPDGETVRLGYAAQNGQGYVPIGRVLADRGEIDRPVTMAKIRAWLETHPAQAQAVMNENPSVVFFQKRGAEKDPVGAAGVGLTPGRSLAVDPHFVALGTPLWLATEKEKRLVVAQDVGGAIKGPVRGDLFWGSGVEAERRAGEMQEDGTYYLLLPGPAGEP